MNHMSSADTSSEARRISKILFGTTYRLEVAAVVARAEPGIVSVGSVLEQVDVPGENASVIRKELEALAKVDLLVRLPRPRGQRVQEYERFPNEYWQVARGMLEDLEASGGDRHLGRG